MVKKFILLTSLVLVLGLIGIQATRAAEIDIRIADGADDVEERIGINNGNMDVTSSDLEFPYEDTGQGDPQIVGMRFLDIQIPQGMQVTEAYLEFEVDETKGGTEPVNVIIEGELSPNASPFENIAMNISQRVLTTALVPWSVPDWTAADEKFQTPNIAAIIQEIVDQADWAAGNAIVLTIKDDPANPSTGVRCAESYNGEATAAPLLHIKFGADPFLQDGGADGIVSMEAENFHNTIGQGDHTWELVGPTEGFTGVAGMQASPNSGTNNNVDYTLNSPRLDFEVTLLKTGTYYVWVRAWGATGSDDSVHTGLDGQAIDTCDRMQGFNGNYAWSNDTMDSARSTFEVNSGGVHTFNVWMREDGLIVDKIVLTTNPDYVPTDDGPAESPRGLPVNAFGPIPADGDIEVDTSTLEWTGADSAVTHRVYLSTDEVIEASEFLIETNLTVVFVELDPGVTYYWRVDEVAADGTIYEGSIWTFSTLAIEAHFPSPADGATEVALDAKLSWAAGKSAIMHDLYFGTDEAAVAAADPSTFKGKLMQTSFDPGPLDPFATYYWRVDEFTPFGTNAGPVWSFATMEYLLITADETTLNYDNSVEPYVSELAFDTPANLTFGGLADVTLKFKGGPGNLSFDEATGTYDIAGSGADIWGNADQFHYVYRELTGDATIVARVVSNGSGSNTWAKGGVMIRQSIAAGSTHAYMPITGGGGNGASFQGRPTADGSSVNSDSGSVVAPPYWVKLERVGNDFSGSISADGVTWTQLGAARETVMTDPVLIGLAVTSHAAGEVRTYTFDNVSIDGNAGAEEMSADVASVSGNTPAPIYVAIEDATGASAAIAHDDPAATMIDQWWKWKIPLSAFSAMGVDVTNATKLYFGVGDGQPGGSGVVTVDDILIVHPVVISESADVTAAGDNILGVPNDGDWPGAETPDLAIDDNTGTKFLHFKGDIGASGFQVEPMAGPTVVTGLTLTTANDVPGRDPASFELYGSNGTIAGPYELIASGDVVDFIQEAEWPRFTKNETPISFDNTVAYKYYQVLFPTIRGPAGGSVNSMQIAEVELIGTNAGGAAGGPLIIWVSDAYDDNGDGLADDLAWIDMLEAEGYSVDYTMGDAPGNGYWRTLDDDKIAALNAADLIIVSRNTNSGDYNNDNEVAQWNSVTTPIILSSTHIVRSSRWKWLDTGSTNNAASVIMQAVDAANPLFAGVALDANGQVAAMTDKNCSFASIADAGNGTVLASRADNGEIWIAEWEAGVEYYAGAGEIAGGPRMFFVAGTQEDAAAGIGRGEVNLTADGVAIFLNAVKKLTASPAPELVAAYAFGSRALDCATYNDPSVNYTMVLHVNNEPGTIQYDPAKGYGYEVIYPTDSPFGNRAGFGIFGPFDDSANNRNEFPDECPEELYDSFIGAKSFTNEVSAATMGDMDTPSPNPEGIIFRVDVPNGLYRFVGAFGEADNGHAHRIIAEDGGSGPPENIGANHVVLVHNHDQSQYDLNPDMDEPGDAVFARVGFDGFIPPPGDGVAPSPVFVDMDENGRPSDVANSPILEVTQGYIRIHQLQGNSNDGPGGSRDANGGDIVILELWKVD